MTDLVRLRAELQTDPLARGYGAMTATQRHASLHTRNRVVERDRLSGAQIFNAIVASEYVALAADKKDNVKLVLSLGGEIDVRTGTNARTIMLDAFGAGTQTRTNLGALVNQSLSRVEELGLGEVTPGEVEAAGAGV